MIETLYSIPCFVYKTVNWSQKKSEMQKVLAAKCNYQRMTLDGVEYFSSDRQVGNPSKYVEEFANIFQDEWQQFGKEINVQSFKFEDVWAVQYEKGDRQLPHTHGTCNLTGVMYFDFDRSTHAPTSFIPCETNTLTNITPTINPKVEEGDIFIFPSNVLHYVDVNTSDKLRTVIAFDITTTKRLFV